MSSSKVAIISNIIVGKVISIIGYTMGLVFLLTFCGFLSDSKVNSRTGAIIFSLIMIGISILLIINGAKRKRLIKRFRTYVDLISTENMIYIDEIASTTSQSIDFVKKDLQIMIARKLFENAYLDLSTNELIINLQNRVEPELLDDEFQDVDEDVETVTCSGCGASNSKQYGVASSCEYCGSPLK